MTDSSSVLVNEKAVETRREYPQREIFAFGRYLNCQILNWDSGPPPKYLICHPLHPDYRDEFLARQGMGTWMRVDLRDALRDLTAALPFLPPDRDEQLIRGERAERQVQTLLAIERSLRLEIAQLTARPDRDSVIEECALVADDKRWHFDRLANQSTYDEQYGNACAAECAEQVAAAMRSLKSTDAPEKE